MRRLFRPLVLIVLAMLVPLLPFLAWARDIEEEDPTGDQRPVYSVEEIASRARVVSRIESVVEDLADRGDRHALGKIG